MTSTRLRRALPATLIFVFAASVSACGQEAATPCEGERPQMCTQVYEPVCATISSDQQRTYPSGCHACMDDNVTEHRPGKCE